MGFCYTSDGRLCCELCSRAPAKLYPCPWGYCQDIAACVVCRRVKFDHFNEEAHRANGCERLHLAHVAREYRARELMHDGKPVRCSALQVVPTAVHVLFRAEDGSTVGRYMSHATYDALPLLEPHTVEDYERHGVVSPAPPMFDYGAVDPAASPGLVVKEPNP